MKRFAALTLFFAAVVSLAKAPPVTNGAAEARRDLAVRMTQGKLETDLANYQAASEAFSSVANDESAPTAMRWEALVRLGLARNAAGDFRGSTSAFRKVTTSYSDDPEAVRFLISAVAGTVPGRIWLDLERQFENILRTGEIVSVEDIMRSVTGPKQVHLVKDGAKLRGIFKQADYRAAIAAYEMDKVLGLGLVPPTVERTIEGDTGALQLWVEGCRVLKEFRGERPPATDWSDMESRIRTFDILIGNQDRNQMNILLDPALGAILIDHTRSFGTQMELERLPDRFDRRLVARLQALDRDGLQRRFAELLGSEEIAGVLDRRDALLGHLEELIADRGEAQVLF